LNFQRSNTAAVFVIQTISYFVIAEHFGNLFGIENTLNFQLEWFIVVLLIIYLVNEEKGFYEYNVISLFMYIVGTIIYMLIHTTTTPRDFIDGTIQTLLSGRYFLLSYKHELSVSGHNVWGSFPSHNNF
jgi:hypothetical protein